MTAAVSAALTALLMPMGGAALPQVAPSNTSPPTITGTIAEGQTIVAGTGSWSGTTPISFAFQWLRCDTGGALCTDISGATGTTYTLVDADVGSRMRVRVTASNSDGSASELSAPTDVVVELSAPQNTDEPSISGTTIVGQKLTASTGTWTGTQPISFAIQWVRCGQDGGAPDASNCTNINGATSTEYTLGNDDVNSRLRVKVTATNSSGQQTVASNPTSTVVRGQAPVNTRRPFVTAAWVEGNTATLNRGTWTGAASFSQQWLRCDTRGGNCAAISGATGTTYRLAAADVGRKVRVDVAARNSAGTTTVRSTESGVIAARGPAGLIVLPNGERSIPVTSVPNSERLIVQQVRFEPNPVRSRTAPITLRVRVKDTRGFVVRDAIVFARSTPLVTKAVQPNRPTAADGWATFTMQPRFNFPQPRNGFNVQFFIKAFRQGDPALAGIAGFRLVQVRLAR